MTPHRVLIGSNEFLDCDFLLAMGTADLLSFDVEGGVPRVSLSVQSPPAKVGLLVRYNDVSAGDAVVQSGAGRTTLSSGGQVLLRAALVSPETVLVEELDLRPLGLGIVVEGATLRIGNAVIAGNTFVGAKVGVQLGQA